MKNNLDGIYKQQITYEIDNVSSAKIVDKTYDNGGVQTFFMNINCLCQQLEDIYKLHKKELKHNLYISRTNFRMKTGEPCKPNFTINNSSKNSKTKKK